MGTSPHSTQSNPRTPTGNYLKDLDYSVLQQCMHCGMCLPTCPTYVDTKKEKNSPRGRISLMRAVVDGELTLNRDIAEEMYFCLGCLACTTACPAGVDYATLFEMTRAQVEKEGILDRPSRSWVRTLTLRWIFTHPRLLRFVGRGLWLYQKAGLQYLVRKSRILRLFPKRIRELEPLTPVVENRFSDSLIRPQELPTGESKYRVALLTGCVQDLVFSSVNRDTADVLLANGCTVITPRNQYCCGSLHGHNGEWEIAKAMARRQLDAIDPFAVDAIITNAAGCGSHLKHYDRLLQDDVAYRERAQEWSRKLKDISEFLAEIGVRSVPAPKICDKGDVTYHEACHLCHGQQITRQPRQVLKAMQGLNLKELDESTWCCGSAGVYNITQPEMANKLLQRKMGKIEATGATIVATGNPGCMVQLQAGVRERGGNQHVIHPVSLLAQAYREEQQRKAK
jgi:glycolate oxidase iron-sulfur subunit